LVRGVGGEIQIKSMKLVMGEVETAQFVELAKAPNARCRRIHQDNISTASGADGIKVLFVDRE